jgi:RimJ/RimL family protein N-acetyltransferase
VESGTGPRCRTHPCGYRGAITVTLAYPDPPLACERFVLRPFRAGDHTAATAIAADPATARWVPPLPADDPDSVVALFERYRVDGDLLHLVIADGVDDAYLGEVMLVMGDHDVGEVGCGVVASQRGTGIATRALRLLDRWSVDDLGVQRLQALVAADNPAGLELARRVGFRIEGVLRGYWGDADQRFDVVMHSMLPAEVPRAD